MADDSKRPIVIKKIKKVAGGHHGGAWKVAYADFVTAMMAFFLLLWLLNVTTKEQKEGIADYFKPTMASSSESGAGGVMGGLSMTTDGPQTNDPKMQAVSENAPSDVEEKSDTIGQDSGKKISQSEFEKMKAEEEQQQFEKAMKDIKAAIQNDAELKELAKNLIVDMTPEGLRIQIVDQQGRSMFPLGSAQMYDQTYQLISKVSTIINKLPQKISIRGHTDSVPYGTSANYDNWNLSADRANASRQALMKAGLPAGRISNVAGKADTEQLFPKDPTSPQNRRISIILMREHQVGDGAAVKGN
ncbi:MAG: ompA family protein [Alphaproteobacteria bacterium]|nr:ompA family protein [Alphaproteobacteria bacterium]